MLRLYALIRQMLAKRKTDQLPAPAVNVPSREKPLAKGLCCSVEEPQA